ncbi:MAG: hypothetical protein WC455_24635, partial [Dehalococcoidia bacterium]
DLAALGYAVGWCTYGAVDVGALHRRNRVFIVGYSQHNGQFATEIPGSIGEGSYNSPSGQNATGKLEGPGRESSPMAHSGGIGSASRLSKQEQRQEGDTGEPFNSSEILPNSERGRCEQCNPAIREIRQLNPDGSTESTTRAVESRLGGMADGLSYWLDEPAGIPRVATGIKNRVNRLKGLGNAVVPQQIYLVYKAIADIESK